MPQLSAISISRLATCHQDLQDLVREAIKDYDFSVICGFRDMKEQKAAFEAGRSKLNWPKSRHNSLPSLAVDLAPTPLDWSNKVRFRELAEVMKKTAAKLNIAIVWGGDWGWDLDHFQLALKDSKAA